MTFLIGYVNLKTFNIDHPYIVVWSKFAYLIFIKKWIFHYINFLYVRWLRLVWGRTMLVNLHRAPGSIDSQECHQEDKFFCLYYV